MFLCVSCIVSVCTLSSMCVIADAHECEPYLKSAQVVYYIILGCIVSAIKLFIISFWVVLSVLLSCELYCNSVYAVFNMCER